MSLDKLVNHLVQTAINDDRRSKPQTLGGFKIEVTAHSLIAPDQNRAKHHREREQHHTKRLEEAEKVFKEKGVSTEVFDPSTGFAVAHAMHLASGNIGSHGGGPKFQAKVDQALLGDVERAKTKLLEHRNAAEKFEKYARAFSVSPTNTMVELSIEDIHLFQLHA